VLHRLAIVMSSLPTSSIVTPPLPQGRPAVKVLWVV